uniref:6-phosphogluconolactonase n=1 Tax=Romanomermis culicivorax TaxID=13658 RepID=A0A915HYM1_ROMCU
MFSSPHELIFYAGTYTDRGIPSDGIYGYKLKFNDDYSNFTYVSLGSTEVISPSFLTITNDKKYLLAVSETKDNSESKISSYKILSDGNLEYVNSQSSLGTFTCYVSVSPNNDFAGVHPQRQEAPHVHMIRSSPSGRYIYVTDLGNDAIYKLDFDASNGFSTTNMKTFKTPAGAGPRHFDFHPCGDYLYLSCELANTVNVFRVKSKETGDLELLQTLSSLPDGVKESMIAEIRVDATGRFLFVSNRGPDNIAVFAIENSGAKLSLKNYYLTNGKTPRNFDVSGQILIAANQDSDNLSIFRLDNLGGLTPIGDQIRCPQPVRVKIL